ncbi:MAG: Rrf2 family transcriptional regulator [Acidimicrobiia bacterium]|nr:Rrf2 family transcriptional regulator [Acidimicrobiia bacterium]
MLSQTSRYVLSVLCYLANRGQEPVPAHRIAAETGAPANYVAKILGTLSRRGVVRGEKGWGGGYALGPRAAEVPLGDLLALFDDHPGPVDCPFSAPICGCRVALTQGRIGRGGRRPARHAGEKVACPYGTGECINPVPCPLQGHWARVRDGYQGLAGARVGDLSGRVAR